MQYIDTKTKQKVFLNKTIILYT